jgi:hypothetical protein
MFPPAIGHLMPTLGLIAVLFWVWRFKTDDAARERYRAHNLGAGARFAWMRWTTVALTALAILDVCAGVLERLTGSGPGDAPIWAIPLNAIAAGAGVLLLREIRALLRPRKKF